ncbi:MAG TPA: VOC family protein [Chitinophagaceae bacterium]
MATINTYLHFNGNCEAAFNYYKAVLGGEFHGIMKFRDAPQEGHLPENEGERILHVALPIGTTAQLMGSDRPSSFGPVNVGDNFYVSLSVDSESEADRVFNALSTGGQALMPMHKSFWGAYFGMLKDKFQIQWMINYDYSN